MVAPSGEPLRGRCRYGLIYMRTVRLTSAVVFDWNDCYVMLSATWQRYLSYLSVFATLIDFLKRTTVCFHCTPNRRRTNLTKTSQGQLPSLLPHDRGGGRLESGLRLVCRIVSVRRGVAHGPVGPAMAGPIISQTSAYLSPFPTD